MTLFKESNAQTRDTLTVAASDVLSGKTESVSYETAHSTGNKTTVSAGKLTNTGVYQQITLEGTIVVMIVREDISIKITDVSETHPSVRNYSATRYSSFPIKNGTVELLVTEQKMTPDSSTELLRSLGGSWRADHVVLSNGPVIPLP